MDILDDMGVSKLSAKVFFKVKYSQKTKYLTILGLAILYCPGVYMNMGIIQHHAMICITVLYIKV